MKQFFIALLIFIFAFLTSSQSCRASPDAIRGLEPSDLWFSFYQISCIPRCSTKEKRVRDEFLKPFAHRYGFQYKEDKKGNALISVPGTSGRENKPTIILQTHLDMVCEKNRDSNHDFDKDPIQLVRSQDKLWLYIHNFKK